MDILADLKARNIFKNITNLDKFHQIPKNSGVYIGFDPTAESLHLGNYVQIALLLRMQQAGYKAVAVIGGATGMIGDPAGRSEERPLLNAEVLQQNKVKITKQLQKFGLEVIDNYHFYKKMHLLDFLRQIGKDININYILNKDTVASRLATGISFTEVVYQLLQGYDFYKLYKEHNIYIQMGGSDQWGNITTGIEIIRKKIGNNNLATGIITNLLTTQSGIKFGKSANNAIWIDKKLTSPYQLYQYFLNTTDDDLKTLFNWLTFMTGDKINSILATHNQNRSQKYGQKILAEAIVTQIHSEKDCQFAVVLTDILFGHQKISQLSSSQIVMLKKTLPNSNNSGKDIQDFLVNNAIVTSRREARYEIAHGNIAINGQKVSNPNLPFNKIVFFKKVALIKKGKKNFFLVSKNPDNFKKSKLIFMN